MRYIEDIKIEKLEDPKYIIFLDIDGVLNHQEWYVSGREAQLVEGERIDIDPKKVELINDLYKSLDGTKTTYVILSSTWRLGDSLKELNRKFKLKGAEFEISGKTPHSESRYRGLEIREFLMDYSSELLDKRYYNFHSYVILDDDSDMLLNQAEKFFQCDTYSGITHSVTYRAKNYLMRYS